MTDPVAARQRAEEVLEIVRANTAARPFTSNHDRSVLARDVIALSDRVEAAEKERDEQRLRVIEADAHLEYQVRRTLAAGERVAELEEALREIADWNDSVEAEDCPTLRGIARTALPAPLLPDKEKETR